MNVIKYPFKVLTVFGMWAPITANSKINNFAYKFYRWLLGGIGFCGIVFASNFLIKMITITHKYNDGYQVINLYPIEIFGLIKYINLGIQKEKIIRLAKYFDTELFKPSNDWEKDQEMKYENFLK